MWIRPRPRTALRTVDVWDTLLRRRCHPDAVKLHVGRALLAQQWAFVQPGLRSARALLQLRLDVERDLAHISRQDPARDDEYALGEVLVEWLSRALQGTPSSDLVDSLAREEFEQECRISYADPSIVAALARHPAPRTLFLTDFYMTAADVQQVLDAHGLGRIVDGGYSSADLGVNKRSGRAYAAIQRLHGVTASEHLHIGDHPRTDVKTPRRLGMRAMRFRPRAEARLRTRAHGYLDDRHGLITHLQRDAARTAPLPDDAGAAAAFRFGLETAPLWLGHALFVLESAQRERVAHAWLFSREGEFFAKVYEALAAASAIPAPPACVLEVSRAATFTASLQAPTIGEMQRLWRLFDPQSMRAWALSLGLDAAIVAAACRRCALGFDEPISRPAGDPRVQRLLDDATCQAELLRAMRHQRELLLGYLAQEGFALGSGTTMVADIGWRGSIQDNLALLFPGRRIHGAYLGLQAFGSPQPANATKSAFGPDLNLGPDHAQLFRNLPLLEMLSSSPQGSVTGYRREGERIRAERLHDVDESCVFNETIQHVQAGVLHAARTWAPGLMVHAVDSAELREVALTTWNRIVMRPPALVRRALAGLKHNEIFGRGRFATLPPRGSPLARFLRRAPAP
jgi:FMN phosphatase YigB (HAD superfamily)